MLEISFWGYCLDSLHLLPSAGWRDEGRLEKGRAEGHPAQAVGVEGGSDLPLSTLRPHPLAKVINGLPDFLQLLLMLTLLLSFVPLLYYWWGGGRIDGFWYPFLLGGNLMKEPAEGPVAAFAQEGEEETSSRLLLGEWRRERTTTSGWSLLELASW